MFKVDLHTHSIASHDGGLGLAHYKKALDEGLLDVIAITDHNRIDYAILVQQELGKQIVIGEEIMTSQGEIIGLYLKKAIQPGMDLVKTVAAIKEQSGLVYIPHPFETVRKGLHPEDLGSIAGLIDLIEVCNGRAFTQNRSSQAVLWAKLNDVRGFASSDAHGYKGFGRTYTQVAEQPTKSNLLELMQKATMITDRPGISALLYPKYHKIRKKLGRKHE
jgi:predicted metal-dependent phosphoesterase TrpH